MELSAKIVEAWKSLTILVKSSILDLWQGSKRTSDIAFI